LPLWEYFVPEVDPSGHIYFSTMPIVKKTFIIDENKTEIEIQAEANEIVLFLKVQDMEYIDHIALNIEDAKSLMMMLDDEITKVQKNQS
jgi:hypothetical protein